jgi:hypothetical protein
MAEEAFALSPISARAALPSEEDYAAISEAFMETSRGRWFLGEYAKRNRNADTSMVLDAVARIEESLAAQRQATAEADAEAALAAAKLTEAKLAEAKLAEARLTEALAAIRTAADAAQAIAAEALDHLELEQKLAPVRKGARVIREISWRLREIGNDGRICDIIDSQVAAIESGAAQISSEEAKAALDAAFAVIAGRLAEFTDDAAPAPVAEAPPAEAAVAEAPTAEVPLAEISAAEATMAEVLEASPTPAQPQASAVVDHGATEVAPALEVHAAPVTETAVAEAEIALADAEIAEVADVADEAAADAHDEAVLDIIAMEMGAPDPFDDDDMADMIAEEAHIEEAAPVEPEIVAQAPQLVVAAMEPAVELLSQTNGVRLPESLPQPPMEVSLGSSIIASGLVRKPRSAANDPLAPIRRMSQAERIAFFS